MGYSSFGEGKVVACGASYLFSSEFMGTTGAIPNDFQKRVYRAEYDLFEKIAGLQVRQRYYVNE
jgi:hypothetical protein